MLRPVELSLNWGLTRSGKLDMIIGRAGGGSGNSFVDCDL